MTRWRLYLVMALWERQGTNTQGLPFEAAARQSSPWHGWRDAKRPLGCSCLLDLHEVDGVGLQGRGGRVVMMLHGQDLAKFLGARGRKAGHMGVG